MSNSTQRNLDWLAAKYAQNIIKHTQDKKAGDVDNTITKALGVLQENGVYACFLYLLAREKENGSVVVEEMLNVLNELGFGWGKPANNRPEAVLAHVSEKVTTDLERLLLAKETLEQMLIYARYGAKARE
ncbi:hypothetical protein [Chloroflexus aggregans]|uniref:CRISPR type III-B/RAMP module-associated protein Cmr5 n=1 Tax=Chloroflexus aggregans (strain MD-66 / DSM 9485) TaxID=326427 RepID=B8GB60_CHLAD|nr:hypothetical protein [Chloroflexus aggregans]ACL26660.1 conserved hypothetical protein [Chloroflexus aggregans DSM 9485]